MEPVTVESLAGSLLSVIEGCRLTAYRDSGGVLTIGFGHTGPDVTEGLVIDLERAYELLAADQQHLFAMVAARPVLEAAALVSFGYNCGSGALARVLSGDAELGEFVHDRNGTTLTGLVTRRALEQQLIDLSRQPAAGG